MPSQDPFAISPPAPPYGPSPQSQLALYNSALQGDVTRYNRLGGRDIIMGPGSLGYADWLKQNPVRAMGPIGIATTLATTDPDGTSYYPRQYADDPSTRGHEMVHQAQYAYDKQRKNSPAIMSPRFEPSAADALNTVPEVRPDQAKYPNYDFEAPAYALEPGRLPPPDAARAAARYTNLLSQYGAGPDITNRIVGAMAPAARAEYQKRYMPTTARRAGMQAQREP